MIYSLRIYLFSFKSSSLKLQILIYVARFLISIMDLWHSCTKCRVEVLIVSVNAGVYLYLTVSPLFVSWLPKKLCFKFGNWSVAWLSFNASSSPLRHLCIYAHNCIELLRSICYRAAFVAVLVLFHIKVLACIYLALPKHRSCQLYLRNLYSSEVLHPSSPMDIAFLCWLGSL